MKIEKRPNVRKAKKSPRKLDWRAKAKALAQASASELKKALDTDYNLVAHVDADDNLCHTVLAVRKRFGYQNTFSYDFDAALIKCKQASDEWSNTDVYDELRLLGWDFFVLPTYTNETQVYS